MSLKIIGDHESSVPNGNIRFPAPGTRHRALDNIIMLQGTELKGRYGLQFYYNTDARHKNTFLLSLLFHTCQ